MRKRMLATAALLSIALGGSTWAQNSAQNNETKGPGAAQGSPSLKGNQGPSPNKEPAEKMAPGGQHGAQGPTGKSMNRAEKGSEAPQSGKPGLPYHGGPPYQQEKRGAQGQMNQPRQHPAQTTPQDQQSPHAAQSGASEHGAGRQAKVTSTERSKIVTAFRGANVREAPNIHIDNIHVGVAVPREVDRYWIAVPNDIVEIVPAWRYYRTVRIGGEILIIDPATFEIVYVLTV